MKDEFTDDQPFMFRLPEEGFLKKSHVLRVIPVSNSTWYDGIQSGIYPPPIKLGRTSVWPVAIIRQLIKNINEQKSGWQ